MYAFSRLRGSHDRFLNPWENCCRGCWSCRGTVWICAPGSGPRRSCLSRRQLGVSMLFAIFDRQALLRELDRCRETVLLIPITQPECHSFSPSSSRSPQFGILQKIFVIFFTFTVMTNVPSVNNRPNLSQTHFGEHTPSPPQQILGEKPWDTNAASPDP